MKVGVLALQGSFKEHKHVLQRLGVAVTEVRLPEDLEGLTHLVLPGGESTTIGHLLVTSGLLPLLQQRASSLALYGTCAGAILMSRHIIDAKPGQPSLGLMNISIRRNAFGRQRDSFTTQVDLREIGTSVPAMFIRAPSLQEVGSDVKTIGELAEGGVITAQQGRWMVTTFHPELTQDVRVHRYFLTL